MEEPINLSDTEDFTLHDTSILQSLRENQDYLIMTIELGNGQQEHLKIHAFDNPNQLAQEFITKFGLDPELHQSFSHLIQQNLGLIDKRFQSSPIKSLSSHDQSLNLNKNLKSLFDNSDIFKSSPEINRKSSKIASGKARYGKIHDRLFQLSKKKGAKTEKLSQSSSTRVYSSYFNKGEMLYIKGIAMQREKMTMINEKNKEKSEELDKLLTFKPNINQGNSRKSEKPEDSLMQKAKEYELHKKLLKEKYDKEQYKECSFEPNSRKNEKSNTTRDIHHELFKDSEKRKEKNLKFSTMRLFPFQPNPDKNRKTSEKTEEFIERLLNSKKKLWEEMEKLRNIEDISGNTPEIKIQGKKLENQEKRHRGGKKIWDYLYETKESKSESIKNALETEERKWQSMSVIHLSPNSNRIFEKFRKNQYRTLFAILDSDNDGKISADKINIEDLSEKNLLILTPLLDFLLDSGNDLTLSEFEDHLEDLRKHLDVNSKSLIIKREKTVKTAEINPFPTLNEVTLKIMKRNKSPEDLYDRAVKSKLIKQCKYEKIKEFEEKAERDSCSFRPSL